MHNFLLFWVLPVGFLAAWYGLSANDVSFGLHFLSREMHDFAFAFYGQILGVDPAFIPSLLLRAILLDTALVVGIMLVRRRKAISAYIRSRSAPASSESKAVSLSIAP